MSVPKEGATGALRRDVQLQLQLRTFIQPSPRLDNFRITYLSHCRHVQPSMKVARHQGQLFSAAIFVDPTIVPSKILQLVSHCYKARSSHSGSSSQEMIEGSTVDCASHVNNSNVGSSGCRTPCELSALDLAPDCPNTDVAAQCEIRTFHPRIRIASCHV